ncbi:MAG: hypothetical protein ACW981_01380 [Candidatus Hodarchaeales archaeon]|jgi:hypothetical protein
MNSEVIQWNVLLEQTLTLTSDLINISERFTSINENSLSIKEVFFRLFYLDLIYCEKINRNDLITEKIDIDIDLLEEFLHSDNIELKKCTEQELFDNTMEYSYEARNKELDFQSLFIDQRKKLLKSLESIFLFNNNKLSRFGYLILNTMSNYSFLLKQGFLLEKTKMNVKKFVLKNSTSFLEKQIQMPSIHLDIVKTFINSLKQKNKPQILDISQSDISFGLLGWLNGFNTLIVDQNETKLEFFSVFHSKYLSFFQNHLIFPPNDENSLNNLMCLKDTLPELKRIKTTSKNIFEGIIANFSFTDMKKTDIIHLLDRLVRLLRPEGLLLIQDYFFDKTSDIPKNPSNIELSKDEFELYLKENSLRILLRMSDFHILKKTSYIILV